jgi:hypothetical protein
MRVSKDDVICGVQAPQARKLMRAYFDERPTDVACEILGMGPSAASNQLREFEAAGYIRCCSDKRETADDFWWVTTIKGNALAQASFGKPIARATATRHLAQVVERARAYNADPRYLLSISKIVVFGSYLDASVDSLGDLDLSVTTVRRETEGSRYVDQVHTYARASGRRFGTYIEELLWPLRELLMTLKNRSPAINITDEDVSKITDRFKIVYLIEEDPGAISPPPDATPEH